MTLYYNRDIMVQHFNDFAGIHNAQLNTESVHKQQPFTKQCRAQCRTTRIGQKITNFTLKKLSQKFSKQLKNFHMFIIPTPW